MGECSSLVTVLTLDRLFDIKTAKGKINWLIFIICKVTVPTLLILVMETDEIQTYGNEMSKYYERSLKGGCKDLQRLWQIEKYRNQPYAKNDDLSKWLQDLNELEEEQDQKIHVAQNSVILPSNRKVKVSERKLGKVFSNTVRAYMRFLEKANETNPLDAMEQDLKYCCKNYEAIHKDAVSCMKKQKAQNGERLIPFWAAMFLPGFGTIFVALLAAPIKRIFTKRSGPPTEGDSSSTISDDAAERLERMKHHLLFFVNVTVFYVMVHEIMRIGSVMKGTCVQNQLCLPKYTPHQMIYLLAMAQTSWISILSNFI